MRLEKTMTKINICTEKTFCSDELCENAKMPYPLIVPVIAIMEINKSPIIISFGVNLRAKKINKGNNI